MLKLTLIWLACFLITTSLNFLINKLREVRDNKRFKKRIGKEYYTPVHLKWHEHIDWPYCLALATLVSIYSTVN